MPIRRIAFLTPANFAEDDPGAGLEAALRLFAAGEALGYDGAWVRSRHLERSVGSAATFLAAATQRTRRIDLGAAVIQLGYEGVFRLAEDLATVDALSGGRLQVGLSAGPPQHGGLIGERLFGADASAQDFTHARARALRDTLVEGALGDEASTISSAAGVQRPRLQPKAPGLAGRLWYGGGSSRSARWAGENGFHLLVSNINQGEQTDDFFEAQRRQIALFRGAWQGAEPPRVALGRVIVPTDSADAASRSRYAAFAQSRHARTLAPQGERRTLFAPDLVGPAAEILGSLEQDPILPLVEELRLELPYDLSFDQYLRILEDFRDRIAPHLGWSLEARAPGALAL